MSTAVIIGIVAIGLFVLVAIAVMMQTMEKNDKEKRRLASSLNTRARNFHYMLEGFPKGFLSRDLQVLVCKCLMEVYQQLCQMAPKNTDYSTKLQQAKARFEEFKARPANTTSVALTDKAQIKDVQKLLTSLHNFIAKLQESKRINGAEAKAYSHQIRRLMVQTSTDGLAQAINEALQAGKIKLAIHYLQLSIEKMHKENADGFYSERIANYQQRVGELTEQAKTSAEQAKQRRAEADAEWDNINKPDDSWKKKALYD